MKKKGVEVSAHFVPPLHKQKYLKKFNKIKLPNTEKLSKEIVTLPIYPNLKKKQLSIILKLIDKWYSNVKK